MVQDIPSPTSVVSCCRRCKGQRQCHVVEKMTPHMLQEVKVNWTTYACRVQRTSRRLDFPRQGTHWSYICGGRMCSYTFCLFLKKNIVAVVKSKVTTTKEQRRTQAGRTTTSTEGRAHRTAFFTAARKPAACVRCWCSGSRNYRSLLLPLPATAAVRGMISRGTVCWCLMLFVVVGPSRRNPKTRKQVVVCALTCSMSPREILLLWS